MIGAERQSIMANVPNQHHLTSHTPPATASNQKFLDAVIEILGRRLRRIKHYDNVNKKQKKQKKTKKTQLE